MSFSYSETNLLCAAQLLYKTLPPASRVSQSLDQTNYFIVSGFMLAYQQNKEHWYLQAAIAHIQSYLELGYANEQNIVLFQKVLSLCGISYSDFIQSIKMPSKQIHPTYNRLSSILGRWPASKYNSHKKPEAIQDILHHIKHMEIGEYQYTAAFPGQAQTRLFRLIITTSSILLYDYHSCKVYSFYPV